MGESPIVVLRLESLVADCALLDRAFRLKTTGGAISELAREARRELAESEASREGHDAGQPESASGPSEAFSEEDAERHDWPGYD